MEHSTCVIDKEATQWPRDSPHLHPQLPARPDTSWRANHQNQQPKWTLSKLWGTGQGETSLPQVKDTGKSLRKKRKWPERGRTMGILALNNTADINHHPALGLPGLDLEPEIYYPPRFVLCVMGTDQKQRGVHVRRKIFPFIPRWVCPPCGLR